MNTLRTVTAAVRPGPDTRTPETDGSANSGPPGWEGVRPAEACCRLRPGMLISAKQ